MTFRRPVLGVAALVLLVAGLHLGLQLPVRAPGAYLGDLDTCWLAYANLRGADLRNSTSIDGQPQWPGRNLRGARLNGSYWIDSSLAGADLTRADLTGVTLKGVSLKNARLRGARMVGAKLYEETMDGADLTGADLRGAVIRGCWLTGANLKDVSLTGATYDRFTRWPRPEDTDFDPQAHGARLSK
jgi:uncharacterized protein YjbI with pentapeptide repeats